VSGALHFQPAGMAPRDVTATARLLELRMSVDGRWSTCRSAASIVCKGTTPGMDVRDAGGDDQ
jgi:hypothetical protein